MAYEMKDNSGNLFVNANKSSEKHPSYKGSMKIMGKQWDIAVWTRRDRNDQTYWAFELSEPYRKPEGGGAKSFDKGDDGDTIPF